MIKVKKRSGNYAFPWIVEMCGEDIGCGRTELGAYKNAMHNISNRFFKIKEMAKQIEFQASGKGK